MAISLESSLEKSAKILEACARMHHYVLDCKIQKEEAAIDDRGLAPDLEIRVRIPYWMRESAHC